MRGPEWKGASESNTLETGAVGMSPRRAKPVRSAAHGCQRTP
uniref:Uncharacterized protein n=1 Tax=Trichinella nativa TaxID=6335 RepID=A0A0V1KIN1_9BILA